MESALAVLVGILVAAATFLLLQRNLLRQIFGIMLLGAGVNLLILTLGRLTRVTPPLVPDGADLPPEGYANPLSQALILTAIVIAFNNLAEGREAIFVVVIFPTPSSYELMQTTKKNVAGLLINRLHGDNINVLDFNARFPDYLEGRDHCSLLTDQTMCVGHYSAEGNRLIATALSDFFKELKISPVEQRNRQAASRIPKLP